MPSNRILSVVLLTLSVTTASRAQQGIAADAGITGRVLAPDGSPVTQGSLLLLRSPTSTVTAAIDRNGDFRIVPDTPEGTQRLFISVPGFTPYRADVVVPASRIVRLPAITLLPPIYLQARFVTADGEPLSGGLRRRFIDADGATIADPLGHVRQVEGNGTILLGPLPRGKLLWAFDRAPLARTRLPDVNIAGTQTVIDRGVIGIQPGRQILIDIRAADGRPVPRHRVFLEDPLQPSLLSFPSVETNAAGRAVFDRLAQGRYRVWTQAIDKCGTQAVAISRMVSSSASDSSATRLVIGGRALIRITAALGPVSGRQVALSPDAPTQAPAPWQARRYETLPPGRRPPNLSIATPSCLGATDSDGRVALEPFPPGPSQLRVSLFNSTYFARLNVPEGAREMVINLPDGLTPVRVTDRDSGQPIGSALVTWTGGGGRVEAFATANGDVLLEAVGSAGGTLAVSAREYQALEGVFEETPGTEQDVALVPSPSARVTVRVVADGKPVRGAVVELHPRSPGDSSVFSTTDAAGIATFTELPPGPLQFTASSEGFTAATAHVAEDARASILITLLRAAPQF